MFLQKAPVSSQCQTEPLDLYLLLLVGLPVSAQQRTDSEPWDSLALVFPAKAPLWLVPFLGQDEAQLLVSRESGE